MPSLAPFGQAVSEEKIASVSFYCQVSDTGSVRWASSLYWSYLPFLYWSYLPFLILELPPFFILELSPFFILELSPFLYCSYLPFLYCSYLPFLYWSLFCTIAFQSIKLELPPFFYFVRLHCNLLNWSYLPFFIFCTIALQSIKLELPPFFRLQCNCTK
jgi:hypothetical protein